MMQYRPTEIQKELLINFVKTYVFSSRYEEVQDETRIEELHKKRNYLAAYCKLVVYNILPTTAACEIFKFYIKVRFLYLQNRINNDRIFKYSNSFTTTMVTLLKPRFQRLAKWTKLIVQWRCVWAWRHSSKRFKLFLLRIRFHDRHKISQISRNWQKDSLCRLV